MSPYKTGREKDESNYESTKSVSVNAERRGKSLIIEQETEKTHSKASSMEDFT